MNIFRISQRAFALFAFATTVVLLTAAAAHEEVALPPNYVPPKLPVIPAHRVSVREYGAVGDGTTNNTKALQAAIDAAVKAGGGVVEVPAGVFLSGPLTLASRVNLQILAGGTLQMLPLDQYPGRLENPADFIKGVNLHDVAITGDGTIDGQGSPWWPYAKTKGAKRPRMIALSSCERILIEGVTLKNSPMFHIAISGKSSHETVRYVTIRAPASTDSVNPSHNTDACDVAGHHILIQGCDVSVGDDNFTCGGQTSDVLITHCTYGYGHGLSIGSYTNGGVSNFLITDCTFTHTDCGIRIKSDRGRGGLVENLVYQNLRMTDVGFPILIYGAYLATDKQYRDLTKLTPAIAGTYPAEPVAPKTPIFRHITFHNITATAQPGHRAGLIWGLPEAPVSDLVLQDVTITADLPFGLFNIEGVKLIRTTIKTPEGVSPFAEQNARIEQRSDPPLSP
jgi:polygalacturonase